MRDRINGIVSKAVDDVLSEIWDEVTWIRNFLMAGDEEGFYNTRSEVAEELDNLLRKIEGL